MDPEEDHGHVLGGSDAPSAKTTLTEIYVPLSCGERVVLGTGELLPFENPTIKYLPTKTHTEVIAPINSLSDRCGTDSLYSSAHLLSICIYLY